MSLPLYIVGGSMNIVEKTMRLNNGVIIPGIGMGTWQIPEEEAAKAVSQAIGQGYRLIDTAAISKNEKGVGEGIKYRGIDREKIFVATKLWNEEIRQETVEEGFLNSLDKLGLAYVDLYLIHWPVPGKYIDAWKTMVKLYEEKKVRAIGVCNCKVHHLKELAERSGMMPMVNQIELHPLLSQKEVVDFCHKNGIVVQAYSPLMHGREQMQDTVFVNIAKKHECTPAQVILRWHLQNGICVIPKSVNVARQRENLSLTHFELDEGDMKKIDAFNQNQRFCADPDDFDF